MTTPLIKKESLALLPNVGREIINVLLPSQNLETYLIGGGVRDLILNRPTIDIDILIIAEPVKGLVMVQEELKKTFTKVQVTQELTNYLTAKVLVGSDQEEIEIDLVFARKEHFSGPGAKAEVAVGTLETDLKRRDFSINALALKITESGELVLVDMVGGRNDISVKKLRILHANSFMDDPIRILRGLRFCSRFNFDFEDQTLVCLKKTVLEAHMLNVSLGRRIFELGKFSLEPNPYLLLTKTNDLKILAQALSVEKLSMPSIEKYQSAVAQLGHTLGFWAYLLSALDSIEKELVAVLPLRKAERSLVFDAIRRGL